MSKESAIAELRRILHAEDECHPGLTCVDEIMEQHHIMLTALRQANRAFTIKGWAGFSKEAYMIRSAIAKAEGKS